MFNIGDYLKKFATFGVHESLLEDALRKAISEKIGVAEDVFTVSIKKSIAYVTADRSTKNLIFLVKGDILDTIAKYDLRKRVTDIR